MTQENESVKKIAEFNALFLTLNEKGQDAALTVLKSLGFAQSVMCQQSDAQPRNPPMELASASCVYPRDLRAFFKREATFIASPPFHSYYSTSDCVVKTKNI